MFEKTKNKKGQAGGGFVGIFMTIGVVAILALVILLVYSNVSSNINQNAFTAAENATAATIRSTTLSGMNLAIVGVIVLAAVGIIGTVYLLMRR